MKKYSLTFFSAAILMSLICNLYAADKIYDISGKRELMIDDFLIAEKHDLVFKQHSPVELPCAPNKPIGHYNVIVQKPDGTFFYYFRGNNGTFKGKAYNNHPGEYVGIAASPDGIKWDLPQLNLFQNKQVPANTIIYGPGTITHNLAPFYDTNPACVPDERYKAVAGTKETGGLFIFSSPDGIKWKKIQEKPVMKYEPEKFGGHMLDSLNIVFYSEIEKCYVMYVRVWKTADGLNGIRTFAKSTSKDFRNWSTPEFLKVNRKGEHLYISGLVPYKRAPHYYIGVATRYFEERGSATDNVLVFSRNGKGIIRPSFAAWINPGLDKSRWLNRMNYITCGIIQENPENMLLYHNRKNLMYRIRTDGFVSLHAGIKTGTFLTKVLQCGRNELEFNVATSAGGAFQVEICDEKGNPIPGYTFADMKVFYGDEISFIPDWNGKKFSSLSAKKFRMRIRMRECDLYSIAFK